MSGTSNACSNRTIDDIDRLIAALETLKKGGVRIPPYIDNSLRLAKAHYDGTAKGLESACEDVAAWIRSNEEYCATQSGFQSYAQMTAGGSNMDAVDDYYICLANKQRAWQARSVEAVLSARNPKSFVAVYSKELKRAIEDVLSRHLKGKAKEFFKDLLTQPPHEKGPLR